MPAFEFRLKALLAAREATRYAMVRGASWSSTCSTAIAYDCAASSSNISAFVQSLAPSGVKTTNLTTTTNWPGTDSTGRLLHLR